MNSTILKRLEMLRKVMADKKIDAFLIPTEDFHGSEYVGDHFQCRRYITGFTGSAGTALVTQNMAGLWTDGRYFQQAAMQLEGTSIELFKAGEPGVPALHEFIRKTLKSGQTLGMDGRTVNAGELERFRKELSPEGIEICNDLDLVGMIWEDRPPILFGNIFELDEKWCGERREDKLARIRKAVSEGNADSLLLSSLEDISWLLNLRAADYMQSMVVLAYLYLDMNEVILFTDKDALPEGWSDKAGVRVLPYNDVYRFVRELPVSSLMMACGSVNSLLYSSVPDHVRIVERENPTYRARAVKNRTEMENMREAHRKDGVAVTRFIYWLKKNAGKERVTELSAAGKLFSLRKEQEHFLCNSFDPIIAYREHGSIIHYSATEESDVPILAEGMVLADTGGQYLEGTTDITRTVVVGEVTPEEKLYYTTVLKGHLSLLDAHFREGCTGLNLDYLAREPLWRMGKDYNHGTGHGVGYLLNVHEGPNGFRWKMVPERNDSGVFEEGMITSDEPGYYEEGKFGIRHERLLLCRRAEKTETAQFLNFEVLTMVPFDPEAIELSLLTSREKELLNSYHRKVRETILPYLPEEEQEWLIGQTRPVEV